MKEKYIDLIAYVEGQEIHWKLSPAPKTLYDEMCEFAGSICEACKISTRNQIISEQTRNGIISVTIFCEEISVPCNSFRFNTDKFLMTNASFEPIIFGFKLEIVQAIAATVVATEKFANITKEDIVAAAKKLTLDTVYVLTKKGDE